MQRTRKDIATLGGTWSPEILWYARAVGALQGLPPSKRTSWRYLGAIHGFDEGLWRDRGILKPDDTLPPKAEWDGRMWNQCQHQGWWFLPWHRGYLWAFEAIVAKTIVDLGGPADWALPYWNYLNAKDPQARAWPAAFTEPTLPDGSPNPLNAAPRHGVSPLGPQPAFPNLDISLRSVTDVHFYTSGPGGEGFGGVMTLFQQFGGKNGALEKDPHNAVHVLVGGDDEGYMFDPTLAGLDPIFWLHHCNVDRLWAAWLAQAGNVQENGGAWRNGPSPRHFEMPSAAGELAVFHPGDTLPGGSLAPTYDDLTIGTGLGGAMVASLDEEQDAMTATLSSNAAPQATFVGANDRALTVADGPVATIVAIESGPTLLAADEGEEPRVMLNLEQVRGSAPSGVLTVSIRPKSSGAQPAADVPPVVVESFALFGLKIASDPAGEHGGNGISTALDVTDLLKRLGQDAGAPLDALEVRLEQPGGPSKKPITVGRVSLYRQAAR